MTSLKPIKHGIILVGIIAGVFIGISFIGAIGFTLQTVNAEEAIIPSYVRTIADYWQKHEVDDDTFTQAIEYLIEQDIVKIPNLPKATEAAVSGKIPDWIHTTTEYYVKGVTSDKEFADSIGFLVGKGIISVKPDFYKYKLPDYSTIPLDEKETDPPDRPSDSQEEDGISYLKMYVDKKNYNVHDTPIIIVNDPHGNTNPDMYDRIGIRVNDLPYVLTEQGTDCDGPIEYSLKSVWTSDIDKWLATIPTEHQCLFAIPRTPNLNGIMMRQVTEEPRPNNVEICYRPADSIGGDPLTKFAIIDPPSDAQCNFGERQGIDYRDDRFSMSPNGEYRDAIFYNMILALEYYYLLENEQRNEYCLNEDYNILEICQSQHQQAVENCLNQPLTQYQDCIEENAPGINYCINLPSTQIKDCLIQYGYLTTEGISFDVIDGADLSGSEFCHAHLELYARNVDFTNAQFSRVAWSGELYPPSTGREHPLYPTRIEGNLENANFQNVGARYVIFDADLRGANFQYADLHGSTFNGDLTGADFRGADVSSVNWGTRQNVQPNNIIINGSPDSLPYLSDPSPSYCEIVNRGVTPIEEPVVDPEPIPIEDDTNAVIIDNSGTVIDPSIKIASDGLPVISYGGIDGLKVAHCDDIYCSSSSIQTIDERPTSALAMAIGTNGNPIISYYANSHLNVAFCKNHDCSSQTSNLIRSPNFRVTSIAIEIGSNGFPIIAYSGLPNGELKMIHCNEINCISANDERNPVLGAGTHISMTKDPERRHYVSYDKDGYVHLKFCSSNRCSDTSNYQVGYSGATNPSSSIMISSNGLPTLAYVIEFGGKTGINVATCTDIQCSHAPSIDIAQIGELTVSSMSHLTITKGSDGFPIVSVDVVVGGASVAGIDVVHCENNSCQSHTINRITNNGIQPSVTIGTDGLPIISYMDTSIGSLNVIHCGDLACSP